jgi:RNA polymerase sigma-70 factor (ECF subfamily)
MSEKQLILDSKLLKKTKKIKAKRPTQYWLVFITSNILRKKFKDETYWWILGIPIVFMLILMFTGNEEVLIPVFFVSFVLFIIVLAVNGNKKLFLGKDHFDDLAKFIISIKGDVKRNLLQLDLNVSPIVHKTNLKAWMFTIMKNIFINNYRRAVKANTIIDKTEDLYYLNAPKPADENAPETTLAYKEIVKKVKELEDEYRTPFEMHYTGYKYKEIADHLGLPIGTVKSRIFLARQKLMSKLKGFV